MRLACFDPENVAGQIEGADLAAAVIQHTVGTHTPGDHLVEIFSGLVLAVDLGIAGKAHRGAHQAQRTFAQRVRDRRKGGTGMQRMIGGGGEHGGSPVRSSS